MITTVDNSVESTGYSSNPYVCEDTNDRIFLLSYAEATNSAYGFGTGDDYDSARRMKTSDYSRANGVLMYTTSSHYGNGWWRLRSPSNDRNDNIRGIYVDGYPYNFDFSVYYSDSGILPALRIRL